MPVVVVVAVSVPGCLGRCTGRLPTNLCQGGTKGEARRARDNGYTSGAGGSMLVLFCGADRGQAFRGALPAVLATAPVRYCPHRRP